MELQVTIRSVSHSSRQISGKSHQLKGIHQIHFITDWNWIQLSQCRSVIFLFIHWLDSIGSQQSIEGLLVILSASGDVNISYMGTQMVQYGFSLPHRGLDRQHCLKEIPRLKQLINNPSSKSSNPPPFPTNLSHFISKYYFFSAIFILSVIWYIGWLWLSFHVILSTDNNRQSIRVNNTNWVTCSW